MPASSRSSRKTSGSATTRTLSSAASSCGARRGAGMADRGPEPQGEAPGQPGIAPTWTSSAKDMVGCSLGRSRIWFTLGFGIVNEVYYPRVDSPQIRDLGFIVADGLGFWVEVKRLQAYTIRLLAP